MADNFSGKRVRQTGLFECGIVKKSRVVQETVLNMKYLSLIQIISSKFKMADMLKREIKKAKRFFNKYLT